MEQETNRDNAAGLYNLGNGLYEQGKYEAAINYYTVALTLKPDYPDALNNRGSAYDNAGKYDAAIADFTATLALEPDDEPAKMCLDAVLKAQTADTLCKTP